MTGLVPSQFRRRTLVCVTGLVPQVVTETLYALAVQQRPAFVPTEIHIISTRDGIKRAQLTLLSDDERQLAALCDEYRLPLPRCDASTLHTITGADGEPLDDIRTPTDNAAAADAITRVVAELSRDDEAALHVSIAGGRKTMGYYVGYALSLYGRVQDRLSHVLVSAPYENLVDFYYPTRQQRVLYTRDQQPVDAREARVDLAEIPFVRLRDDVTSLLTSHRVGFSAAVLAADRLRHPANVGIDGREGRIVCDGVVVELPAQLWLIYVAFAWRRKFLPATEAPVARESFGDQGHRAFFAFVGAPSALPQNHWRFQSDSALDWTIKAADQFLSEKLSRLHEALEAALGAPALARRYGVTSLRGKGRVVHYQLAVAPENIHFLP